MANTSNPKFEESILYKTHQHPMVIIGKVLKYYIPIGLPVILVFYFLSEFSLAWTIFFALIVTFGFVGYYYYLWSLSWLLIGNQKITLYVRDGIFSQYSMNIRYRNIRDSACSKNNIFSYIFKYGTFFARSSGADGDFTAKYVPKVGKVYALVNALTRYSDEDRESIKSIEELHSHHITKEFPLHKESLVEKNTSILLSLPGVTGVVELRDEDREFIKGHEEARNHGVYEVLRKKHILCLTHDEGFRLAEAPITETNTLGETIFPAVPFSEIEGKSPVSASPSVRVHRYLAKKFEYITPTEATVLVGWDE